MSDYSRTKAIVYPVSSEDCDKLDKLLSNEMKNLSYWDNKNMIGFGCDIFDTHELRYYLIYQLYHSYGEESGDFGSNRLLNEKETAYWTEKFKPVLEAIGIEIDPKKLKYLDWCYYNACESLDYYIIEPEDTIEMDKKASEG